MPTAAVSDGMCRRHATRWFFVQRLIVINPNAADAQQLRRGHRQCSTEDEALHDRGLPPQVQDLEEGFVGGRAFGKRLGLGIERQRETGDFHSILLQLVGVE